MQTSTARKVRDIMTTDVITVGPDTSIAQAAALMLQHKMGCLPVVDGGRLAGIVTESDFVVLVLADGAVWRGRRNPTAL